MLLLIGAAVAGPALVVAGVRYPGGFLTKGFLAITGIGVTGATYYYLSTDVRALISGPSDSSNELS